MSEIERIFKRDSIFRRFENASFVVIRNKKDESISISKCIVTSPSLIIDLPIRDGHPLTVEFNVESIPGKYAATLFFDEGSVSKFLYYKNTVRLLIDINNDIEDNSIFLSAYNYIKRTQ